jgi:hypothetical protein
VRERCKISHSRFAQPAIVVAGEKRTKGRVIVELPDCGIAEFVVE